MISLLQRQWRLIASLFILIFYIGTIQFAAQRDGDIVHMWIGGRTIALGQLDSLYDPATHYEILEDSHVVADEFWGGRYDILGAFFYPPPTALLYATVGWLDLYQAQIAVAVLNILIGLAAVYALYLFLDKRFGFGSILIGVFTFPSFFYTFTLGQNGALTLAIAVVAWLLIRFGKDGWAGSILAILVYKPNWLVVIGWAPVLEKRWRFLVGGILGGVILLAVSASILGIQPFFAYADNLFKIVNLHDLPDYPIETQYSFLAFFRRNLGNGMSADILGWGLTGLVVGATMWLIGVKNKPAEKQSDLFILTAGLSWVTATLFNPHLHHYDLMLAVAAALVALIEWPSLSRNQKVFLGGIFLFNHVAFLIESVVFKMSAEQVELVFLPTLAVLFVWGWLFSRVYQLGIRSSA